MTAEYHLYGQQLGWHALYLVAGEYLSKHPVVQRPYDDLNPWCEWLSRQSITKSDGLWLADGVDWPPVDAQVNLREKSGKSSVLTGDKLKLLSLLKIGALIGDELVVAGDWRSVDGIDIRITSALGRVDDAKKLAVKLAKAEPFRVWLPQLEEHDAGGEYSHSETDAISPWIVWPYVEAGLDETDSLGVTAATRRLYFSKAVNAIGPLKQGDPFRRTWIDPTGRAAAARSEARRQNPTHDEQETLSGERLICSSRFLKKVLLERSEELLILIVLRKYDKGYAGRPSEFWHTTGIVRIGNTLDFKFLSGKTNERHASNY